MMVILEHHQGLTLVQLKSVDEVADQGLVALGRALLEGQVGILVDFQVVRRVRQVQDMTSLVWNE